MTRATHTHTLLAAATATPTRCTAHPHRRTRRAPMHRREEVSRGRSEHGQQEPHARHAAADLHAAAVQPARPDPGAVPGSGGSGGSSGGAVSSGCGGWPHWRAACGGRPAWQQQQRLHAARRHARAPRGSSAPGAGRQQRCSCRRRRSSSRAVSQRWAALAAGRQRHVWLLQPLGCGPAERRAADALARKPRNHGGKPHAG
jgi:hypothetical protein